MIPEISSRILIHTPEGADKSMLAINTLQYLIYSLLSISCLQMAPQGNMLQNTYIWDDSVSSLPGTVPVYVCAVLMLFLIVCHFTIAQVWTINYMVTLAKWGGSGACISIWGREIWKKDQIYREAA